MDLGIQIVLHAADLEDIHALLQSIRDCERDHFPEKAIAIVAFTEPPLPAGVMNDLLTRVSPPLDHVEVIYANGHSERKDSHG